MTEHLARAAKTRHEETMKRARSALLAMAKTGETITFAAVARKANVSTDFLYNTTTLRSRITDLRQQPSTSTLQPQEDTATSTTAIRVLSAQLKQQRRRHREELQTAHKALAAAHGENLRLRRVLAHPEE